MSKKILSTITSTVLLFMCSLPVASADDIYGYKAPNNVMIRWGESYATAYKKLQKLQYKWGINHDNKSFEITDNKTFPDQSDKPGGAVLIFEENGFSRVTFGNLTSLARTKEILEKIYGRKPDKETSKKSGDDEITWFFWFGEKSNAVLDFKYIKSVSMTIVMATISKEKFCPLINACDF